MVGSTIFEMWMGCNYNTGQPTKYGTMFCSSIAGWLEASGMIPTASLSCINILSCAFVQLMV